MDLTRLSKGEKIAGGSAIALFIFMFFDWFSVSVHGGGGFGGSVGSGSAWDALDNIPIFLVITIVVALGVVGLRLADSNFEPPVPPNAIVAGLGAISVLLILFRIIDTPGGGSFGGVSVDVSPTFGIFISLIAAAGITWGGYLAMDEEGTSLGDLTSGFGAGGTGTGHTPTPPPASHASPPPPPAATTPPPPAAAADDTPPAPPPAQ